METLRKELLVELARLTSPLGMHIVELNAMEGKRGITVTVVVDKGGKTSLEDCERITNLLNARLEILEIMKGRDYSLQVSSPGTSRVFKSREEYDIFRGRRVRMVLREPIETANARDGSVEGTVVKKTNVLDGLLGKAEGDSVALVVSGETMKIPFSNIRKTRLNE